MSEAAFKQLEARVKSLEDWQQRIIQADIAAPTPQPKVFLSTSAEIAEYCEISENTVKPKAYIGNREVWARINEELKSKGFKWVSEGKNSRWVKT